MKERVKWLDFIKGIASLLVILSHTPDNTMWMQALFSFVMIPAFFLCSGYVCDYDGRSAKEFLYYRVLKLLILYSFFVMLLPFCSISEMKGVIAKPSNIIDMIKGAVIDLISGKGFWFVACLIIVNIIFCIIQTIGKGKEVLLLFVSAIITAIGFVISKVSKAGMNYWSADTALVCLSFFCIGYLLKKHMTEKFWKRYHFRALGYSVLYIAGVVLCGWWLGYENISINVALNNWKYIPITILLIFIGNLAFIYVAKVFENIKLITYIGKHSLLYFAIGSHGMSIMNKAMIFLFYKTGLSCLQNRVIINPLIAIGGAIILLPVCLVSDKFFPFVNGKFRMPKLVSNENSLNK